MKIGIDISQTAYEKTGVANYLEKLVENLISKDDKNEYVLFFSSLRRKVDRTFIKKLEYLDSEKITFRAFPFPPVLLDFIWNRLHWWPIEWFVGDVDIFITSDWTEPPATKAKKATILYDLIVYKNPGETDKKIVSTQKRKHLWVVKESKAVFCISQATKKDAQELLGIDASRLHVIYPGVSI